MKGVTGGFSQGFYTQINQSFFCNGKVTVSAACLNPARIRHGLIKNCSCIGCLIKDLVGLERHHRMISAALQSQLCAGARGTPGSACKCQCCASPLGSDGSQGRKDTPSMFPRVLLQSRIYFLLISFYVKSTLTWDQERHHRHFCYILCSIALF